MKEISKQFYQAIEEGDLSKVKAMVAAGAIIRLNGNSAINIAAIKGHLEIVKYLIEKSGGVIASDIEVVHISAEYGHMHIHSYICNLIGGKLDTFLPNYIDLKKYIELEKKWMANAWPHFKNPGMILSIYEMFYSAPDVPTELLNLIAMHMTWGLNFVETASQGLPFVKVAGIQSEVDMLFGFSICSTKAAKHLLALEANQIPDVVKF